MSILRTVSRASNGASQSPGSLASRDWSPTDETKNQRREAQVLAVTALLVSVGYLVWRALFTLGVWWVSVPMLLLEIHATFGLALFTFSLWELRITTPYVADGEQPSPQHKVAVLIATYDEPEEVLLPTVAGAVALQEPHPGLGRREPAMGC